jgi:hypothetical protein
LLAPALVHLRCQLAHAPSLCPLSWPSITLQVELWQWLLWRDERECQFADWLKSVATDSPP